MTEYNIVVNLFISSHALYRSEDGRVLKLRATTPVSHQALSLTLMHAVLCYTLTLNATGVPTRYDL